MAAGCPASTSSSCCTAYAPRCSASCAPPASRCGSICPMAAPGGHMPCAASAKARATPRCLPARWSAADSADQAAAIFQPIDQRAVARDALGAAERGEVAFAVVEIAQAVAAESARTAERALRLHDIQGLAQAAGDEGDRGLIGDGGRDAAAIDHGPDHAIVERHRLLPGETRQAEMHVTIEEVPGAIVQLSRTSLRGYRG